MSAPLDDIASYSAWVYSLAERSPQVAGSTLALAPIGATLARLEGRIECAGGMAIEVWELIDFATLPACGAGRTEGFMTPAGRMPAGPTGWKPVLRAQHGALPLTWLHPWAKSPASLRFVADAAHLPTPPNSNAIRYCRYSSAAARRS